VKVEEGTICKAKKKKKKKKKKKVYETLQIRFSQLYME
jgi:hypothetical protein